MEQNNDIYLAGKPYAISYINTEGETITTKFTPEQDMNIVQIITKFKNDTKDFFKLYSIVPDIKEEMVQKINDNDVLTESKEDNTVITMDEKQFKDYVQSKLSDVLQYIKLLKCSKMNKSNQWGVYIYGEDIEASDGTVLNGLRWYVPYDEEMEFVDKFIDLNKEEIKQFYGGKDISMKTENKKLLEDYEVWQVYFSEDGTTTTEYVQSFDDYEKAERFAQGLNEDPNCQAWVKDKKEESLNEEYIPNHNGEHCPKCGSNEYVEVDDEETEDGRQIYHYECAKCGYKSGSDEYGLEESKKVTESKYRVCSYYDEKLQGLEDKLDTDDFNSVEDFCHNKLMQGNTIKIVNTQSGKSKVINPDKYNEDFNGEFVVSYEELEENKKITEAYEVHNELNPKLWNNETMELLPEVQESLEQMAQEFINYIDIPLDVADIEFIGSNASYNYNSQSDIDLHIIVNFDLNYVDDEILQTLYNSKKNSFNDNYDLNIKGIPVELYVQDIKAGNASLAIYSVQNKQWVKQPEPIVYDLPNVDEELTKREEEIDNVLMGTDENAVKDLLNDIYMDRKNGLAVDGEASKGNVVFKALRNEGYLELLRQKYYDLRSDKLSINENKKLNTKRKLSFGEYADIFDPHCNLSDEELQQMYNLDKDAEYTEEEIEQLKQEILKQQSDLYESKKADKSKYDNFEPYVKSSKGNTVIIADKNSDFEEEAVMIKGANKEPRIEWQCYYLLDGHKVIADRIKDNKELLVKLYSPEFYNKANDVAFKYLQDKGIIEYNDEENGGWIINK